MSSIVKLNVGGKIFATSKSTLTKFEGFFKTLLETDVGLKKDESGCIFIDRSPKHFDLILNYMRDGDVTVTKNHEEVMAEAKFYLLEELVKLCKPVLPSRGFKISIINDEQLLQILADEPLKPVLLILYHFNEKMYLPENTLLYGIVLYFSPRFDVYFKKNDNAHENGWSARIITWPAGPFQVIPGPSGNDIGDTNVDFSERLDKFVSEFLKTHVPRLSVEEQYKLFMNT